MSRRVPSRIRPPSSRPSRRAVYPRAAMVRSWHARVGHTGLAAAGLLDWRAEMPASPATPGPPVRRLALALRPDRELEAALKQVCAWANAAGVELFGAEGESRLPPGVVRRPEDS